MRSISLILIASSLFTIIATNTDEEPKVIKLCSVCACSELKVEDANDFYLNIICSEVDKIVDMPDLNKIEWPENRNRLKVAATFDGLGLATLVKLPPNSYVEILSFPNNVINVYWPNVFSDVPNLKKLVLSQNELQTITSDLFTKMNHLEELNLGYNKLETINTGVFENLKSLKKLNLQMNQIKIIPLDAIEELDALEELDLGKNMISDVLLKLPNNKALSNVKRLSVYENRIRKITNDAFPHLNSFEFIDISSNKIETIDEHSFMYCTSLTELNLSKNNITFNFILPSSMKVVNLAQNTIHRWPAFPSNITFVDLSFNKLTDLFESEDYYESLEILNIAGNQIKNLLIRNPLTKLFELDLSYNLLEYVPESISEKNLPSLIDLRLDGNPFHVIYFKNIISLRYLSVSSLPILDSLDEKAFSNVNRESSQDERNCFSLFMSNCKSLSQIKVGAFEGTSLCSLDLSSNNLTSLPQDLLPWTTIPDEINLQANPWDCGCHLQWIIDLLLPYIYKKHPYVLDDFRCNSPAEVQHMRMVHFYNWTERPMCGESHHNTFWSEKTYLGMSSLSLILGVAVIIALLIAIALTVYLVKTRKRYNIARAKMNRKRQNKKDFTEIRQSDQYKSFNRA